MKGRLRAIIQQPFSMSKARQNVGIKSSPTFYNSGPKLARAVFGLKRDILLSSPKYFLIFGLNLQENGTPKGFKNILLGHTEVCACKCWLEQLFPKY